MSLLVGSAAFEALQIRSLETTSHDVNLGVPDKQTYNKIVIDTVCTVL